MNYTLRTTAALCAATLMLNASCKKHPDNTSEPTQYDRTQANKAFAPLQKTPQKFTVTAGVAKKIMGAEGTILSFYPNSFKDKNGNIITTGNIDIELTELYKLGDMIAHRTSTVTSAGVLTSGGELNIKATMNGQEVFANTYGVGFKSPTAATSKPMELYYGDANNPDSVTTWKLSDTGKGRSVSGTTYITDSSLALMESPYFLFINCTSFNMVNCDHPYDAGSGYVRINVHFTDDRFKNSYYPLAIAFPSLNIATNMYFREYNNTNTVTFVGYAPLNRDCKFALIIPKGPSVFYYYEKQGQVTDEMDINADMQELSTTELKAKLSAL
jgi:hypothetical protein